MKKKIRARIINLGFNNIFSLEKALTNIGYTTIITELKSQNFKNDDILFIPGVGNFHYAMKILNQYNIKDQIYEFCYTKKRPIIGICLGMQLLFQKSTETKITNGLSLLEGSVDSIPKNLRTNIGWLKIKNKSKKFMNKYNKDHFYFVHSYHCRPKNKNIILTESSINDFNFCSSVHYKNIFATQFHPEKSGKKGINLLNTINKLYF